MRGGNHRPVENFSTVIADLDDEVPTGMIEIFLLGGKTKCEGGVVACCLYLAVIGYLIILITPYLDAALSRIVLYETATEVSMHNILVARQGGFSYLIDYALNGQMRQGYIVKEKVIAIARGQRENGGQCHQAVNDFLHNHIIIWTVETQKSSTAHVLIT